MIFKLKHAKDICRNGTAGDVAQCMGLSPIPSIVEKKERIR